MVSTSKLKPLDKIATGRLAGKEFSVGKAGGGTEAGPRSEAPTSKTHSM